MGSIMKTVKYSRGGCQDDGEVGPLTHEAAMDVAIGLALKGHHRVTIEDVQRPEAADTRAQVTGVRASLERPPLFTREQIDEIARQLGLRIAVRPPGH